MKFSLQYVFLKLLYSAGQVGLQLRSNPNFKLFSMLIIRTLKNYPDSSDFLQLFNDFLGRERGGSLGGTPLGAEIRVSP